MRTITFKTLAGTEYRLSPVAMACMPSSDPRKWLIFQGKHVLGSSLSESAQNVIQQFMLSHKTEALTDGKQCFTLAGGMLASCYPDKVA